MSVLSLAPIPRAAMEFMGDMPPDELHEFQFDLEGLLKAIVREQVKAFNEAYREASVTLGVQLSTYYVDHPGYVGMYLN